VDFVKSGKFSADIRLHGPPPKSFWGIIIANVYNYFLQARRLSCHPTNTIIVRGGFSISRHTFKMVAKTLFYTKKCSHLVRAHEASTRFQFQSINQSINQFSLFVEKKFDINSINVVHQIDKTYKAYKEHLQ